MCTARCLRATSARVKFKSHSIGYRSLIHHLLIRQRRWKHSLKFSEIHFNPALLSQQAMAKLQSACAIKLLIVGHGFVQRLPEFMDGKTVHWHNIEFCLVGEATARTLKTKLGSLDLGSLDLTNFCAAYVEICTNGQRPLQLLFWYRCSWHIVTSNLFTWPWSAENRGKNANPQVQCICLHFITS